MISRTTPPVVVRAKHTPYRSVANCATIGRAPLCDDPAMPEIITAPKPATATRTERPKLYKVILLNDDFTPRDFVVSVLKAVFRMTESEALGVMLTAHRKGACVVAVYTKEVAETKADQATEMGRSKGYPLGFTTEKEE